MNFQDFGGYMENGHLSEYIVKVFGDLVDVLLKIDFMSFIIIILFSSFVWMFWKACDSGRINWLDLVRKPKTGELSLTKVIQLFGGIVATWVIIKLALSNNMSWDIFAIYLAYVGSIEGFSKFVAAKYGTINLGQQDQPQEDYGDYDFGGPPYGGGYGNYGSRRRQGGRRKKPDPRDLPPDTGVSLSGKDEITEEDVK